MSDYRRKGETVEQYALRVLSDLADGDGPLSSPANIAQVLHRWGSAKCFKKRSHQMEEKNHERR